MTDSFGTVWTVACKIHTISLARILEWVAILITRGSSWPRDWAFISWLVSIFFTTEPPGKPHASRNYHLNVSLELLEEECRLMWVRHSQELKFSRNQDIFMSLLSGIPSTLMVKIPEKAPYTFGSERGWMILLNGRKQYVFP